MRFLPRIAALTFGAVLFCSCPSDPPGDGFLGLRIRVTAAPGQRLSPIQGVKLQVRRIDLVHQTDAASPETVITIDREARAIDVSLVAGNVVIVGVIPSPPGLVSQLRFVLDGATANLGATTAPIKTPSAEQSGLKLVAANGLPFAVKKGMVTTLEAQFEPDERLVNNKGVGYLLKPTVPTVEVAAPQTFEDAAGIASDYVEVFFRKGTPQATITQILSARQMTVRVAIPEMDYLTANVPTATMSVIDAIDYLIHQSAVQDAFPSVRMHDRRKPNDYNFAPSWVPPMQMEKAWDVTTGSERVIVGLVENGFNLDHPDLALNLFVNEGELPAEFLRDVSGHKLADCNLDGVVSMYDLNCLDCTFATAPQTATETCRTNMESARAAACTRAPTQACIPTGPILPSVLIASLKDGDSDPNGGNGKPDDIVGWNFVDNNNNPSTGGSSTGSHGMEMAGIIGAVTDNDAGIAGVAWRVRIVPLRSKTTDGDFQAIDYAARQLHANVINMSRGITFVSGKVPPSLTYNGQACQFNFDVQGANAVAGKHGRIENSWGRLDLSGTLLSAAPPNCRWNINADAGDTSIGEPIVDWPLTWSNPSVIASSPSSPEEPTGDAIAIITPGGPGPVMVVDGGYGGGAAGKSTSYSAAYVSGAAALVSARFPSLRGPCLRTWMAQSTFLNVDLLVRGVVTTDGGPGVFPDGGIKPFSTPGLLSCF